VTVGDAAALDLAATIEGDRDRLGGPRELERWLGDHAMAAPGLSLRLADFRGLRAAVRSVLASTVEARPLPPDAVATLNDASAAAPTHAELDAADPTRIVVARHGPAAAGVFAEIARSAIEIVGGPDRERLRSCPAAGCGRFFLATRPDRTWCSPACGNRVRVARHHERRRARGGAGYAAASGSSRYTGPDSDSA
jgi:predicted RNA-binding Zn ribbon-like protein